ncbi:MAG: hypothetical protein WCH35_16495 [Comamonadaceae bacterium]
MPKFSSLRLRLIMAMFATVMLATACGGGGADVGSGGTGFVSGTVTKGPVGNATVAAYGISSGQMGAQIGAATTDVSGNFRIDIGTYSGPVLLQMSGGSYTDEATGATTTMASGDVMTAVMPSVVAKATTSGIQVTPLTAMAQKMAQHMTGGMTETNIATANTAMGNTFTISDILHIAPMNPLVKDSGLVAGVTQDSKNYGMTLAAMSQYAQTLGLSSSSSVVTAMMNDATDGKLDGMAGSTPVRMGGMGGGMMMPPSAGTSGMGGAMNTFMMNSTLNISGVTTPTLVDKLNAAGGQIGGVPPVPVMNTTVSGMAFNGLVSSATVMAFAVNNGVMGAQIASVATDSQGNFTMPLGSYTGPVLLQMSGASYTDEATNKTMTMAATDVMSAVLPTVASGAAVTGVWITPVTSMAQTRALAMTGGMTDTNIADANTAMGNYFLVSDILHTQPMNPLLPGAGAVATPEAKNYGMTLAAMSQYAKTLNMTVSSTLVMAMMNDASDGVMNGKKGTSSISMAMGGMMGSSMMAATAGTSGLATAMTTFMSSAANASGLSAADMAALMLKLTNSNGQI